MAATYVTQTIDNLCYKMGLQESKHPHRAPQALRQRDECELRYMYVHAYTQYVYECLRCGVSCCAYTYVPYV